MSVFPDIINISINEKDTSKPVPNMVIDVKLFAKHKNNYDIIYISNEQGKIIITKDYLNSEIEMNRNMFIMDYSSNLDDCEPKLELFIMSQDEVNNMIYYMNEWKKTYNTSDSDIDKYKKVLNGKYQSYSEIIYFKGENSINHTLTVQTIK